MRTDIDYKNNVLNIRIDGVLIGNKVNKFESETIPIVIGLNAKYVSLNLSNVELIDKRGINSIIKLSDVVNRFNGKVVLCNLNDYLKENFKHSDIFDYCFKSKNEKTSLEVFKI